MSCSLIRAIIGIFALTMLHSTAATMYGNDEEFFAEYIEPMLETHCYDCHSHDSGEASGGLVLDSKVGWSVGGDSGPAVVPGDPNKSPLWTAVTYKSDHLQMPPEGPLEESQLLLLRRWIESGAVDPRTTGQAAEKKQIDIEAGREWWSFQPLTVDSPVEMDQLAEAIDALIAEELARHELHRAPRAEREELLRRLSYDLTGLPPAFFDLQDLTYPEVVDLLLESQQFGEKWGRHWLDLARYADSNGSSFNPPFPEAWRYRNWVIDSINADLPVDQFLRKQIAGDLLEWKTQQERDDNLIATGYLMLGSKVLGTFDKEQLTLDVIDEQVDTLGKSLLGMTLGCARCHDHKFDPIPHFDYYALAGIFASTVTLDDRLGGPKEDESDWSRRGLGEEGDDTLREFLDEHRYAWIKARSKRFQALRKYHELQQKAENFPDRVTAEELDQALATLEETSATFESLRAEMPAYAMAVRDQQEPEDIALRIRGVASSKGAVIPRGFLQVASFSNQPSVNPQQSGRLELAHWITSAENPLTARVFVNRVWKHLLREGLVRSVDNFGTTGETPTHPELLDTLAASLIHNNWHLKPLVRQIVLSETYRQAVVPFPATDPENRLLASQHRRRLEPEEIRDTLLVLSCQLNASPTQGMLDGLPISDISNLGEYLQIQTTHRTIYQPVFRTLEPEILQLFDSANNAMVTGARPRTIVAPQALYFMNSKFVQRASDELASQLLAEQDASEDLSAYIHAAFERIVNRPPTAREEQLLVAYLRRQADGPPGLTQHDVMKLCQAILGSTQFQYLD